MTSVSVDGTNSNPDGDFEIQTGATLIAPDDFTIGGDFLNSGTITSSPSQLVFFSAAATGHEVDDGTGGFGVVDFLGVGGGWTLGSNFTTTGASTASFSIEAGTLNNGGFSITGNGATDTFTVANGAFFEMSGTSAYPASFTTYTYGATSTVRYLQTNGEPYM